MGSSVAGVLGVPHRDRLSGKTNMRDKGIVYTFFFLIVLVQKLIYIDIRPQISHRISSDLSTIIYLL
jgi:hypothetical protein